MQGIIEVTVKLYLEMDLDEEDAREVVENMIELVVHPLISHTEVVSDNVGED
jgi:hypothetical protein